MTWYQILLGLYSIGAHLFVLLLIFIFYNEKYNHTKWLIENSSEREVDDIVDAA